MSNLNMDTGWKQLIFILPLMLIGFYPLLRMTFFKGDITKELVISEVQQRSSEGSLEILGLITNTGNRTWTSVTVEAEFFDASGTFVDEAAEYVDADIAGNAQEHFKIRIKNPNSELDAPDTKLVVKVAGGHTSPF
ncbi:MAG: FxLYD domain-containing protein [Planctomycetaceae bacterium]|nr:FxLYD domain-containing protein [Planctomycetaceae bacterium]